MASSVAPNAAYPVPRRNPPLTVLAAVDIEDAAEDRDWKIIKNAYGAELSLAIVFSFPAQTLAFSYCTVFSRLKHTQARQCLRWRSFPQGFVSFRTARLDGGDATK